MGVQILAMVGLTRLLHSHPPAQLYFSPQHLPLFDIFLYILVYLFLFFPHPLHSHTRMSAQQERGLFCSLFPSACISERLKMFLNSRVDICHVDRGKRYSWLREQPEYRHGPIKKSTLPRVSQILQYNLNAGQEGNRVARKMSGESGRGEGGGGAGG